MKELNISVRDTFHAGFAEANVLRRARSKYNDGDPETEYTVEGPLIGYFQALVEEQFIVSWADAEYDVEIVNSFWHSLSDRCLPYETVEFTLITDKWFRKWEGDIEAPAERVDVES